MSYSIYCNVTLYLTIFVPYITNVNVVQMSAVRDSMEKYMKKEEIEYCDTFNLLPARSYVFSTINRVHITSDSIISVN